MSYEFGIISYLCTERQSFTQKNKQKDYENKIYLIVALRRHAGGM